MNPMPCLARFLVAFSGSHSNCIAEVYLTRAHLEAKTRGWISKEAPIVLPFRSMVWADASCGALTSLTLRNHVVVRHPGPCKAYGRPSSLEPLKPLAWSAHSCFGPRSQGRTMQLRERSPSLRMASRAARKNPGMYPIRGRMVVSLLFVPPCSPGPRSPLLRGEDHGHCGCSKWTRPGTGLDQRLSLANRDGR